MQLDSRQLDRLFGTYVDVVAAYRDVIAELTVSEQDAVLAGTARRVYGVAP